ncbi:MAG: aldo/keto reductase [Proteobacteria bacterium]|nr:aldo/keto reductase [Pseudomonadota bacterium]
MSPGRFAPRGEPINPLRRDALRLGAGLVAGMALPGLAAAPLIERPIPKSGESLPAVGLGTWQSFDVAGDAAGTASAREVLRLFAAGGGRLVDSSPMYGSAESLVGDLATELGVQGRLFHATKVWTGGREAGIAQRCRYTT